MEWLTSIFSGGAAKLVGSVGDAIDSLVTSDEERLQLKNELDKITLTFNLEIAKMSLTAEKEITKRWTSDNEHLLTRLIRPLSYMAVLILFGSIVIADGNIGDFIVNESYIPVLETLLATMTIAYFGSRGVEKTMKHFKKEG